MTIKKDLKKRVRDRQIRTGESYTTAREQVLAERQEPGRGLLIEMVDLSAEAARVGLKCRHVYASPKVLACVDGTALVEQIRAALVATGDDPVTKRLRSILLRGERPPEPRPLAEMLREFRTFLTCVQAGIGGASRQGSMLAFEVRGQRGTIMVVCALRLAPDPLPDFLAAHADAFRERYPALWVGTAEGLVESRGLFPWL